jgi:hypothetical protein
MKSYVTEYLIYLGFILSLSGCLNNDDAPKPLLVSTAIFKNDAEGWEAQFAEYEPGLEDSLKLSFNHTTFMVSESVGQVSAVKQSGYATNSDLFMYIKRQISGFKPNTTYDVFFSLELYAQLNEDFNGDLDDPDNGSFLKVGILKNEPDTMVVNDIENLGKKQVITNFEKGEDKITGPNMAYLGKIEHTDRNESPLLLIATSEGYSLLGTADDEGKMWVMVGVDTNQPIYQSIFYSFIGIQFEER